MKQLQSFGCQLKATAVFVSLAFSCHAADTSLVYYHSGEAPSIETNLAGRLTAAGLTPTIQTDATALPTLSTYKQVWDIRGGNAYALTQGQQDTYLSYMQGGGTLFVMGESAYYGSVRNASIVNLITAAGGGTPTIGSSDNAQTVQGSFATTPNAVPTVTYGIGGGMTNVGSGTCITQDNSNRCGAVAYGAGKLANAKSGVLITVLDNSFLKTSYINNNFVDNLIAYLTKQAEIAAGGGAKFVPVSSTTTQGAASVLDTLSTASTVSAGMASSIGALSNLSDTDRANALKKLTPATSRAVAVTSENALFASFNQIGLRLDGMRFSSGGAVTGLSSGDEAVRQGGWLKSYGVNSSQGQRDGHAGYRGKGWGVIAGVDRQLTPALLAGLSLSYSDSTVDYRDQLTGNSNDIQSTQLSVYLNQNFGRTHVDAILAYAKLRNQSVRNTVVNGMANGHYTGDQWGVRLGAGHPYALTERLTLTPMVRAEWNHVKQQAYTESGGGALALNVASASADRVRSSLGGQMGYDTEVRGFKVQPYVRAFWHHDFKNNGVDSSASFVGGGASFVTPGQQLDRNSYSVGIGANLLVKKDFTAALGYDHARGRDYRSHTAQATLRWMF